MLFPSTPLTRSAPVLTAMQRSNTTWKPENRDFGNFRRLYSSTLSRVASHSWKSTIFISLVTFHPMKRLRPMFLLSLLLDAHY